MTLTTHGSVALHGTYHATTSYSCRKFFAKISGGGSEVPMPVIEVDNYKASFMTNLEGWKGPGNYNLGSALTTASFLSLTLVDGQRSYGGAVAGAKNAPSATAHVNADGAVAVRFSNLAAAGHPSSTVSGSANYVCKDL